MKSTKNNQRLCNLFGITVDPESVCAMAHIQEAVCLYWIHFRGIISQFQFLFDALQRLPSASPSAVPSRT